MSSTLAGSLVVLGAGAAAAQTAPDPSPVAANQGAATVKEVVVTGSRIPRPNLTSVSPITAVPNQEFKLEGATDVVDVIDNLPQAAVGLNNTPNPLNSGLGYTTVNLRGLGATRTLVLVDGKRLGPGDPTLGGDVPNLDMIPPQLVDRVEVVTGGASAVYGSDAVAGVVNFIMKHNFEGVQLDAQWGIDQHDNGNTAAQDAITALGSVPPRGTVWDGRTWNTSLLLGANSADGKGNVTAYFGYRHQEPVSMGARDFAACLLGSTGSSHFCSGSANSNYLGDANHAYGAHGTNSYQVVGGAGANKFVPWGSLGQSTVPPQIFNAAPYQYLSRQDERYQAGFFGHYDLSRWAQAYGQFVFMRDASQEFIAPGGSFLGNLWQVNCDNPFLNGNVAAVGVTPAQGQLACLPSSQFSSGVATIELGRRNIEGGPRESFFTHNSFRGVIGMKGNLDDAWSYDLSGVYTLTDYTSTTLGFFSKRNLQNALQVQDVGGTPTCVSVINGTDPLCQPYNPFVEGNGSVQSNPANGVTQAALNYLQVPSVLQGEITEQVVNLNFVGLLGKYGVILPWANEGVGVSFGAEYRRDFLSLTPDAENASGDLVGGPGVLPAVKGAYDDREWYAETRIPIVQDHPWAKDLNLELGYRRADYSLSGTVGAYKLGAEWAPTVDLRFRASFQRAVRAPNVNELFYPVEVTNTAVLSSDPCAGANPSATLTQCERTGVTASQYGTGAIHDCPAGQCGTAIGGNQALKPETSDTTSLGFVFTPSFFPGFNFTADYFNIDVMNAISTVPVNVIMTQCLATGDPTFCNLIHRNAQGEVWGDNTLATGGYVVGANENIGFLKTSGIDFQSDYRWRLRDAGLGDNGSVTFNFIGTFVQKYVNEPVPGLGSYDCVGFFGPACGSVPAWRHKLRATWDSPWKFQLSLQWRFIGAQTLESYSGNPLLAGAPNPIDSKIPNYNYFDVATTWAVRDGLVLRAGVNNILDKDPPWLASAITGTGSPNSFPSYDLLGRVIFVGLTANW